MKTIRASFFQRLISEEQGQTMYILAFGIMSLLGIGGMAIDVGHAYLVRNELQVAANSAVLASVDELYLSSTTSYASAPSPDVVTAAQAYDASPANTSQPDGTTQVKAGYNYNSNMGGNVLTTVTTPCLSTQLVGVSSCSASNWNNEANAVRVKEQAAVPTTLMQLFGVPTLTVGAISTALPKGQTQPYNIAIILDATLSMGATDSNCNGVTEEQCALEAIESMLAKIYPCINTVSCTASSSTSVAADRVSIFSFPNVSTGTVAYDETCGGTPTFEPYTLPKIPPAYNPVSGDPSIAGYVPITYTPTSGSAFTATYQMTPAPATPSTSSDPDKNGFSSDWYPGSGGEVMNPNSYLVKVVGNTKSGGGSTTAGCLTPPNYPSPTGPSEGETYFASSIYAAQAALQAEKYLADPLIAAVRPGITSTNVIIFVSDGQANAYYSSSVSRFPPVGSTATTAGSAGVGGYSVNNTPTTTWTSTAKNMYSSTNGTWGTYPDSNDDCQQAIAAAQYAITQGTVVYGVAYGSETNGCLVGAPSGYPGVDSTNASAPITGNAAQVHLTAPPTMLVPCVTIEDMVSNWKYFYAETSSVGCASTLANPMGGLAKIFSQIAGNLGPTPRLIPNSVD